MYENEISKDLTLFKKYNKEIPGLCMKENGKPGLAGWFVGC